MNQKTKDEQLLLIEKLRRQFVADVLEKTDLLLGDFTVDVSISHRDDANNDFYEAAKEVGWQHDKHDGSGLVWYTSEKPEDGETVVFGASEVRRH